METGIELIAQERREQIEKHGRSKSKDVAYNDLGQLSFAAVAMASEYDGSGKRGGSEVARVHHFLAWCPLGWDKEIWKKMIAKPYKDRLVIAGALIAAEIDRLQAIDNPELLKQPTP